MDSCPKLASSMAVMIWNDRPVCHLMLYPIQTLFKQSNTQSDLGAIKILIPSPFMSMSRYILHVWYLRTKLHYFSNMHLDMLFSFVSWMFYFYFRKYESVGINTFRFQWLATEGSIVFVRHIRFNISVNSNLTEVDIRTFKSTET